MAFYKHGAALKGAHSPTYRVWSNMRRRCLNPSTRNYHRWGGRGIGICARWSEFSNFLADMGERPPGASIDRIDNNGNYEPGNCRWVTGLEQRRKTSLTKLTMEMAVEIVRRVRRGERIVAVARSIGVRPTTASDVVRGKRWKGAIDTADLSPRT